MKAEKIDMFLPMTINKLTTKFGKKEDDRRDGYTYIQ